MVVMEWCRGRSRRGALGAIVCHWIEVLEALMAMVVSPWCRILTAARQDLRATLSPLSYFLLFLLVVHSCVVFSISFGEYIFLEY